MRRGRRKAASLLLEGFTGAAEPAA